MIKCRQLKDAICYFAVMEHRTTHPTVALAAFIALTLGYAGCSLVSVKSPEKPLSALDLNTRILTREFSTHFNAAIVQTADTIADSAQDPEARLNALRWKIAAVGASQRAASQIAPMIALLDTWALSVQMHQYLGQGADAEFGHNEFITDAKCDAHRLAIALESAFATHNPGESPAV